MELVTTKSKSGKEYRTIIIGKVATKSCILSIEEPPNDIGKVILSCTKYGDGKESVFVRHYMDIPNAMLLAFDILNRVSVSYSEYKESKNNEGVVEVRTFSCTYDEKLGRGKGGYALTFKSSQKNGDGSKDKEVTMIIEAIYLRTLMAQLQNYLNAYTTMKLAGLRRELNAQSS